jgi:hypothetical protein
MMLRGPIPVDVRVDDRSSPEVRALNVFMERWLEVQ